MSPAISPKNKGSPNGLFQSKPLHGPLFRTLQQQDTSYILPKIEAQEYRTTGNSFSINAFNLSQSANNS